MRMEILTLKTLVPKTPNLRTVSLSVSIAVAAAGSSAASAETYQWMNDPAAYGYFCQYSIPNALADESCAPASATNTLVFLQNTYASQLGGVQLVGSGYGGWNATAQTLQGFFGTTQDQTTSGPGMTGGLEAYLQSVGAASLTSLSAITFDSSDNHPGEEYPEWVQQHTTPTFGDFHGWLAGGDGVYFQITYGSAFNGGVYNGVLGGHVLSLVGLEWNDANGDGVVDQSENATFSVIDPLDPSLGYAGSEVLGPAYLTELSVWQEEPGGLLQFSYLQYHGALPFDGSNFAIANGFIGGGLAISVIPAPAVFAMVSLSGFCGSRRRR